MEVRPVWEVRSPLEGERACEELRSHGIKCDCLEMLPPSDLNGRPIFSLTGASLSESLYVVVAADDAERAKGILQAWQP